MKWILPSLSFIFLSAVLQYSFFNQPIKNPKVAMDQVHHFLESIPSLPRYVEGGYSPLGRSPVVDALLAKPLSAPTYGQTVASLIKQENGIFSLSTSLLEAGGIPLESLHKEANSFKTIPEAFKETFNPDLAKKIYTYWRTFMKIEEEVKSVLNVLSEEEKNWIKTHYKSFFFGDGTDYDFFTTESLYPFQFYEKASKVDIAKLADCARN